MNTEQQRLVNALTSWVVDGTGDDALRVVADLAGLTPQETDSLITLLEIVGDHVA